MAEDISESNLGSTHLDDRALLTAMLADITAIRAEVVKLVTDMGSRISDFNTLTTKLNADDGVTDTNYAAATAITAAAPAALTVQA
jgi:hypothetical protein